MAKPISAERLRTLQLQNRVFQFATCVVGHCPQTVPHLAAREIWSHLVAAAVSTSNNLEEADEASSDADFVAKMKDCIATIIINTKRRLERERAARKLPARKL